MTTKQELRDLVLKNVENTKELVEEIRKKEKVYSELNLDELENTGLIIKKGAWYFVPNMSKVPESFSVRVSEMKQEKEGIYVKIKKNSPLTSSLKKFEKLGY